MTWDVYAWMKMHNMWFSLLYRSLFEASSCSLPLDKYKFVNLLTSVKPLWVVYERCDYSLIFLWPRWKFLKKNLLSKLSRKHKTRFELFENCHLSTVVNRIISIFWNLQLFLVLSPFGIQFAIFVLTFSRRSTLKYDNFIIKTIYVF